MKSTGRRFELPALDFKFSLTEGTNIPPPQPSPVRKVPTPPPTPSLDTTEKNTINADSDHRDPSMATPTSAEAVMTADTKTIVTSAKPPADDLPLSPALSSRQGSIRRLFSRNTLHSAYSEAGSRPASRAGSSGVDDKRNKRTSGWFRRLRGAPDPQMSEEGDSGKSSDELSDDNRRTTMLVGPPPPMIPEFGVLETKRKSADTWGTDLFKNIE